MTCIVGIKTDEGVLIAGDSLGSNGHSGRARQDVKVFTLYDGQLAIGYTTSFRMGQLLRFHLSLDDEMEILKQDASVDDVYSWLVKRFVPEMRKQFKDHGFLETVEGAERGGTFLIGLRGLLFEVNGDFQVGQPTLWYESCGSGEDVALGALHALLDQPPATLKEARAAAGKALSAAEEFVVSVRGPWQFAEVRGPS